MRRIQIHNQSDNKSFSIKLNSQNQTFKTPITKTNNSVSTVAKFNKPTVPTSVNTSSSQIETKTDINNKPVDDLYYDEIIYYDGGGVEGYGD